MPDNSDLFGRLRSEVSRAFARVVHTVVAPDVPADPSIAQLVDSYLAELRVRARPRSIKSAERSLAKIVGELGLRRVRDIDKGKLIAWRRERIAQGAAHKTVNTEVGALKAALAWACHLGTLKTHPLDGLKGLPITGRHMKRRARSLTEREVLRILEESARSDHELGHFPRTPFLHALVATGARYGELRQATWGDLETWNDPDGDEQVGSLRIRPETAKTARQRTLPLGALTVSILLSQKGEFARIHQRWPASDDRLFVSPKGCPWPENTGNFLRWLRSTYKRAGIEHADKTGRVAHVHALRKTFASWLARYRVPPATAMSLTGHETARVLIEIYQEVASEDGRAAIKSLPSLRPHASLRRGSVLALSRGEEPAALKTRAVGFGPPTSTRLTAACSTIELSGNEGQGRLPAPEPESSEPDARGLW